MKKVLMFAGAFLAGSILFAQQIKPVSITASSTLIDAKIPDRYSVMNLVDEKNDSWVEGDEGDGTDSFVTFDFGEEVMLTQIVIRNGYGDLRYWEQNNRAKDVTFSFDGKGGVIVRLYDNPGYQLVQFRNPEPVRQLKMFIDSVYKGSKYEDTAIAEISFNNWDQMALDARWDFNWNKDFKATVRDVYLASVGKEFNNFSKSKYQRDFLASNGDDRHFESPLQLIYPTVYFVKDGSFVVCWGMSASQLSGNREDAQIAYVLYSKIEGNTMTFNQNLLPYFIQDKDIEVFKSKMIKGNKDSETYLSRAVKFNERLKKARMTNSPFMIDDTGSVVYIDDINYWGKNADPAIRELNVTIDPTCDEQYFEYLPPYFITYEVGWR